MKVSVLTLTEIECYFLDECLCMRYRRDCVESDVPVSERAARTSRDYLCDEIVKNFIRRLNGGVSELHAGSRKEDGGGSFEAQPNAINCISRSRNGICKFLILSKVRVALTKRGVC